MRWLGGITDSLDVGLSKPRELDGRGGLVCCSPRGRRESDTTERVNHSRLSTALLAFPWQPDCHGGGLSKGRVSDSLIPLLGSFRAL